MGLCRDHARATCRSSDVKTVLFILAAELYYGAGVVQGTAHPAHTALEAGDTCTYSTAPPPDRSRYR